MSKTLQNLQPRNIRDAQKRGLTIQMLCALYNCNEEQLHEHICKLYSQNNGVSEKIWKDFKSNQKYVKKHPRNILVEREKEKPVEEEVQVEDVSEDTGEDVNKLETLKAKADEISNEVIGLENEHRQCEKRRQKIKENVKKHNHRLTEIRREVLNIASQFSEEAEEFNQLGKKMIENSGLRARKVEELDLIREAIRKLEAIQVFVYKSGEIVANIDGSINDAGYQQFYDELLHSDEDYLDLKKSQLQTLAKVLAITKNAGDVLVEYAFDDQDVEFAFEVISQ